MINKLFRFTWFPLSVQIVTLAGFILIIAGGITVDTDDMGFAKVLRNTNAANLMVWSYWWPVIILAAIFLGRAWCTACPMALVTTLAARIGLKRKPPAFLTSGWGITLLYVLILFVGINMLAIHRVPHRMAIYMLVLLAMAVASGLLFSRNAFCAHLCPVGHLLGLYARLAPFGWGVKDKKLCGSCEDQSCVSERTAGRFQGRSCDVGLKPGTMDDNTECILCGQCLKACDRNNNPGLVGRPNPQWAPRRFFKDILSLKGLTPAQAAFCLVVSGFVIYEVFVEWGTSKSILFWSPTALQTTLGAESVWAKGLIKSLTLFVALPLLIWVLPYGIFRVAGGVISMKQFVLRFGVAFIPIMAAAHGIKSLCKTTSRIPYWEYVFADPLGTDTARHLYNKTWSLAPLPAWRDPAITALAFLFMVVAICLSAWTVRKLNAECLPMADWRARLLYLIPGLYGGLFMVQLIAWRFI